MFMHESGKIQCEEVQFGYAYSLGHISAIQNKVLRMRADVENSKKVVDRIEKSYDIKGRNDIPLIPSSIVGGYLHAKRKLSIAMRELAPMEMDFNFKKLSRSASRIQPTVFDIINFAKEKNAYPKDILAKFETDHIDYAYPVYIVELAKNLHYKHKTFVNADEAPLNSSRKWFDKAVSMQDKTFKKNELRQLVDLRTKNFNKLKKIVINDSKKYIRAKTLQRLGRASRSDLNWIHEIEDNSQMAGINFSVPNEKLNVQKLSNEEMALTQYNLVNLEQDQMNGFFKKFLKKVLSPLDKLVVSPFMKIASKTIGPVAKTILPSDLYSAVSTLSAAQARLLVGDISKQNLRNMARGMYKTALSTSTIALRPTVEIGRGVLRTSIGQTVDKYSGGLLTSAQNLQKGTVDYVSKGRDVDAKLMAMDAFKVGLAVSAGGTAIAWSSGSSLVGDKTGLNKSGIGKVVMQAGTAYASGGGSLSDVATSTGINLAQTQGARTLVKTGVIRDKNIAQALVKVGTGSVTSNASLSEIATGVAKSQAEQTVKKEVVKKVGGGTAENILIESGFGVYDNGFSIDSFQSEVTKATKKESIKRVDRKLNKYGLNVDKVTKYGSMTPEELQEHIQSRVIKAEQDMVAKKEKYLLKMDSLQSEISKFSTDELKAEAQRDLEKLETELADELKETQETISAELGRMANDASEFDTKEFISDELKRIEDRALAERDGFKFSYMDALHGLKDKYGDELLMYLMYKYGPKAEYQVSADDYARYKTWNKPRTARLYNHSYSKTKIVLTGLAIVGSLYAIA